MATAPVDVDLSIVFTDIRKQILLGRWEWSAERPLEVRIGFVFSGMLVPWVFCRDLLVDALARGRGRPSVGSGDVRLFPVESQDALLVTLVSPHGRTTLRCSLAKVAAFVDETILICSGEDEQTRMDQAVEDFLAGEGW